MIDLEHLFRYKIPDSAALLANGFVYSDGSYRKDVSIMQEQFVAQLSVTDAGAVQFKVCEAETGEEYVLVHAAGAEGGFIGDVRSACEQVLTDLSNTCFHTEHLKAEQAKRIAAFIRESYGVEPEYLWERYPDYAAFRVKETKKWFAVIMAVDRAKLGLPGRGTIEIMDLKDIPERVAQHIGEHVFLNAYHMNKKHWYTLCLDGQVPDEEIHALIRISYELAAGKK